MGIVVKGLSILLGYLLGSSRLDVGIISVICIPVGVFIFGILAIKFNLFTKEEYMAMPGGNKIIKIIDKLIPSQSCNCKGVRFSLACLIALSNQEKKVLSLMFKI